MAKAPVVDRFRISCEANQEQLGVIIAMLTKMGFTNVNFDLISDVPRYKRNNVAPNGVSATDFARAWVKDHPTFKAVELARHFDASGDRTKGMAYHALNNLVEEKVVKALGGGNYARADVKRIAGPKKAKVASTAKGLKRPADSSHQNRYKIPNADLIIMLAGKGNGDFTLAEMKKEFSRRQRPPSSCSPCLQELIKRGRVGRVGEGAFKLLPAAEVANG